MGTDSPAWMCILLPQTHANSSPEAQCRAMASLSPAVPSSAPLGNLPLILLLRGAGNHSRRRAGKVDGRARKGRVRSAPRNRVLLFGKIRELALYRAEVLRAHGFLVAIPESKVEAVAAIRQGDYDVAVFTYTLSNDTVEELAELVRQHSPDCRLITISDARFPDLKINPDANVLADEGPKALLEALRETLRRG